MATTTPNFGWQVPTSTDYVKDGAVAIETLGDAIDASLVDLKGGTTGQVLSKNTNTDMDFVWVTPNDADAIQNTIVDAKGDLITATAADTPARLAVGTNGQYLQADSTTATGLKWATVSAGGMTEIASGTFSTASVTLSNIPTTYKHLQLVIRNVVTVSGDTRLQVRPNNNNASNYQINTLVWGSSSSDSSILISGGNNTVPNSTDYTHFLYEFFDYAATNAVKFGQMTFATDNNVLAGRDMGMWSMYQEDTVAITSIVISNIGGYTMTGNYYLYGIS